MADKNEKQSILLKNSYNDNEKSIEQNADNLLVNNDLLFKIYSNEATFNINNAQSNKSLKNINKNLNNNIDNNKSK